MKLTLAALALLAALPVAAQSPATPDARTELQPPAAAAPTATVNTPPKAEAKAAPKSTSGATKGASKTASADASQKAKKKKAKKKPAPKPAQA